MFDISGFEGNPFLENFLEYKFYHFLEGKTSFDGYWQKLAILFLRKYEILPKDKTQTSNGVAASVKTIFGPLPFPEKK